MSRIDDFDVYQKMALRTAGDFGSWESRMLYGASLCSEEGAEVLGAVRKQTYHDYPRKPSVIAEEVGDMLWAAAYMARQLGFDLSEIAAMNIDKLRVRYPDGFVTGGGKRDKTPLSIVEDTEFENEDPED